MSDIALFGIIFVGVFLLIATIFITLFIRQRNDAWTGVVENKSISISRNQDDYASEHHYLHIKLDDTGKITQKHVSKKAYDAFNIGDHLIKTPGKMDPTKD